MREMKRSGIEWVFSIPSDWGVVPLKSCCTFGKGVQFNKEGLVETGDPIISYGQIHSKKNRGTGLIPEMYRYVPAGTSRQFASALVNRGSFLFATTSEDVEGLGNCAFINCNEDIIAGTDTISVKGIHSCEPRYLAYLFTTDCWRSQFRRDAIEVKVYHLTLSKLKRTHILLPPIEEQRRIAGFLDERCAVIDAEMAILQNEVSTLHRLRTATIHRAVTKGFDGDVPMRDSGFEWIGAIPSHWRVIRIKNVAERKSGHTPDKKNPSYWDGDIVWVSLADSPKLRTQRYISNSESMTTRDGIAHSSAEIIQRGAVLLSRDASVGLCAITGCELAVSQHFMAYICGSQIYNEYLLDVFHAMGQELEKLSMGTTIPTIGLPLIKNLVTPLPPIDEQHAIERELSRQLHDIDSVIETRAKQISRLEDYRKALIFQYVTGKKEVPHE